MKEKLKGALEKIKAFFKNMSKKTRILLGSLLVLLLVGAAVLIVVMSQTDYAVLFTGLNETDMSSVVSYLEENGATDYRIQNNDTILVPADQEPQLKAQLIMADLPGSGFAYSTYLDNVGSLSTESDRQTAFLFELQDRLSAVIRCLDGVKDAHVTIAQGEDRRYVLDSDNMVNASAAIMVTMQDGKTLTDQQATAIRNLVSRSVQGLEIDNIEISDSQGNTYSGGGAADSSDASQLKLQLEEQMDRKIRSEVLQALIPLYGEENVRVSVTSTVDVSRRVGESTEYTVPEGAEDGQGILGKEIYDQEVIRGDGGTTGGVVGTTTNSDIPTYVEGQLQADDNSTYVKNQGENDYSVNSNTEQVEHLAGTLTDVMVAVTINSSTAGNVNVGDLLPHVARAAGIGEDVQDEKISILAEPFYSPETPANPLPDVSLPSWALYAAIGGGVLFLLLLLLFALLRRRRRKKEEALAAEEAAAAMPLMAAAPIPVAEGADIMNIRTEKSMELRKDIREFADENPEIAAQMVKSWLRGGDDSNG